VHDVYNFGAPAYIFPGVDVAADPRTGLIATATGAQPRPPYAVADTTGMSLAGNLIAQSGRLGLFRLDGPLRLGAAWEGFQEGGWIGTDASYTQYWNARNARGLMAVEVSRAGVPKQVPPTRVRVLIQGLAGSTRIRETLTIRSGQMRTMRLATPRPPFRVRVHAERTFSPADYGELDTRQLGARVSLRFRPRA
jgi:hypothetical protein